MIAITETTPVDLKKPLKPILLILSEYADLAYAFIKDVTNILPEYREHNLHLKTRSTPPFGLFYNFSQTKLKVF